MKKIFGCLMLALLMVGCSPSTNERTEKFILPKELEGYKIYYISSGPSGFYAMVPSDPTSGVIATATPRGKTTTFFTIVIDGKKYKAIEENK